MGIVLLQFRNLKSRVSQFQGANITHFKMGTGAQILVDVRTPAEFLTGAHADALNIEYQKIEQLPAILAQKGVQVRSTDPITLYCRSGRRSNIALQTLKGLGYDNVRDIGGYEEAMATLARETFVIKNLSEKNTDNIKVVEIGDDIRKEARENSLAALMKGLQDCQ
jgi:rhodanese-related sulfurtransferase